MLYKLVQICTILSKLLKTYKKFCTIFKIMFITNCIILYNIVGVVQLNTQRPPARPPPPPPASAAAARTAAAAAVRETARPRRPMTRMVGPGASDRRLSAVLLLPLRRRLGPPPPPSRPRRPPARERLEAGNLFRYIYILGIDSGCAGAPSSSAHWARHPGPSAAARKPCNFKSKCPSLHEHSLNHHNALRHFVSDCSNLTS